MSKVILSGREAGLVRNLCCKYVRRLRTQQNVFPLCREIETDLINYSQLLADKFQVYSLSDNQKKQNHGTKRTNFS